MGLPNIRNRSDPLWLKETKQKCAGDLTRPDVKEKVTRATKKTRPYTRKERTGWNDSKPQATRLATPRGVRVERQTVVLRKGKGGKKGR